MKMKMNNELHGCDINKPRPRNGHDGYIMIKFILLLPLTCSWDYIIISYMLT